MQPINIHTNFIHEETTKHFEEKVFQEMLQSYRFQKPWDVNLDYLDLHFSIWIKSVTNASIYTEKWKYISCAGRYKSIVLCRILLYCIIIAFNHTLIHLHLIFQLGLFWNRYFPSMYGYGGTELTLCISWLCRTKNSV